MGLQIIVPGVNFTGRPSVLIPIPTFGGALYAAYFLGSGYGRGAGFDWSGNGRTGDISGATIGSTSLAAGVGSKVVLPFTGAQLAAANGQAQLVGIAKVPTTSRIHLVSCSDSTNRSIALAVLDTTNGSAFTVDAGTSNSTLTGGVDANRATRFEMWASRHAPTLTQVTRRYNGGTLISATAQTAARVIGGASAIQIGYPISGTTFPGPAEMPAAFFYNRTLTDAELEELYTAAFAFLASFGVAP